MASYRTCRFKGGHFLTSHAGTAEPFRVSPPEAVVYQVLIRPVGTLPDPLDIVHGRSITDIRATLSVTLAVNGAVFLPRLEKSFTCETLSLPAMESEAKAGSPQ